MAGVASQLHRHLGSPGGAVEVAEPPRQPIPEIPRRDAHVLAVAEEMRAGLARS